MGLLRPYLLHSRPRAHRHGKDPICIIKDALRAIRRAGDAISQRSRTEAPHRKNHNRKVTLNMRILYINNEGGGFADYVEVSDGTTVQAFFGQKMPGRSETDFLIRVNRQPVARDHILQEGDRITITPTKIEGAA